MLFFLLIGGYKSTAPFIKGADFFLVNYKIQPQEFSE